MSEKAPISELNAAVEGLYRTFSRYARPRAIECCPCGCSPPGATAHLIAVPLRELKFPELSDYSFSAMTTQGSVDDFRYFLPRLFQGMVEESYAYNPEILFGKLRHADWTKWPQDEISSLRVYLQALWRASLSSFPINDYLPAFLEIETVLASIARTGEDLEPYLEVWSQLGAEEAEEHFIQFVTMYGSEFAGGKTLSEAFWADSKAQALSLRRWLLRADTLQQIADSAHLLRNDGFEYLFEPALSVLRAEARLASKTGT